MKYALVRVSDASILRVEEFSTPPAQLSDAKGLQWALYSPPDFDRTEGELGYGWTPGVGLTYHVVPFPEQKKKNLKNAPILTELLDLNINSIELIRATVLGTPGARQALQALEDQATALRSKLV